MKIIMNRVLIFLILNLTFFHSHLLAQVSITTDNSLPDNSAMLDVKSTTRGMLIPRMTAAQRDAISNPARGLLIFCTDNNYFYSNRGYPGDPVWVMVNTQWSNSGLDLYYTTGNVGIGTVTPQSRLDVAGNISLNNNDLRLRGGSDGNHGLKYNNEVDGPYLFGWNGGALGTAGQPHSLTWDYNGNVHVLSTFTVGGDVGIGTSPPNSSAIVDISSTTKGLLPPRMTSTQMNAIASPAEGLTVYNTTIKSLCWFNGTSWDKGTNRDGQSCGSVDYGGKTYNSVVIGMQCWMSENLNIGTLIPGNQEQANNGVIEKYCYNNNSGNCEVYGGLYQWAEMVQYYNGTTNSTSWNPLPGGNVQGICPLGWHLPTDAEWTTLTSYLGGEGGAGGKLKETGTTHWSSPNTGATNSTGFTALPGGERYSNGAFYSLTNFEYYWSSSEYDTSTAAWGRFLFNSDNAVTRDSYTKTYGFSVRCLLN